MADCAHIHTAGALPCALECRETSSQRISSLLPPSLSPLFLPLPSFRPLAPLLPPCHTPSYTPLQELEEEYDKARSILKEALRAANWTATVDSTYSDYLEALAGNSSSSGDGGGGADGAAAAAADKEAVAEAGEAAEASAAAAGDEEAAAADGDAAASDEGAAAAVKGAKGGGLDSALLSKVAAVRDSHKRVYFEEQVRGAHWTRGGWGGGGETQMQIKVSVWRGVYGLVCLCGRRRRL